MNEIKELAGELIALYEAEPVQNSSTLVSELRGVIERADAPLPTVPDVPQPKNESELLALPLCKIQDDFFVMVQSFITEVVRAFSPTSPALKTAINLAIKLDEALEPFNAEREAHRQVYRPLSFAEQ